MIALMSFVLDVWVHVWLKLKIKTVSTLISWFIFEAIRYRKIIIVIY